jgi:hypothetical protein
MTFLLFCFSSKSPLSSCGMALAIPEGINTNRLPQNQKTINLVSDHSGAQDSSSNKVSSNHSRNRNSKFAIQQGQSNPPLNNFEMAYPPYQQYQPYQPYQLYQPYQRYPPQPVDVRAPAYNSILVHPKPQRPNAADQLARLAQGSPDLPRRPQKESEYPGLARAHAVRHPRVPGHAFSRPLAHRLEDEYAAQIGRDSGTTSQMSFRPGRADVLDLKHPPKKARPQPQRHLKPSPSPPPMPKVPAHYRPSDRHQGYYADDEDSFVGSSINYSPTRRDSFDLVPRYHGRGGKQTIRNEPPASSKKNRHDKYQYRNEDEWLKHALGDTQRTAPPARPHPQLRAAPPARPHPQPRVAPPARPHPQLRAAPPARPHPQPLAAPPARPHPQPRAAPPARPQHQPSAGPLIRGNPPLGQRIHKRDPNSNCNHKTNEFGFCPCEYKHGERWDFNWNEKAEQWGWIIVPGFPPGHPAFHPTWKRLLYRLTGRYRHLED